LLDLAILYFDGVFGDFGDSESDLGANSTAATITEAQLTSAVKDKFAIFRALKRYNAMCCFEDKLVDSEMVAPPDGQIMHTQSKQRRVLSISRRSV
jgi:hypothetical protein